MRETPPANNEEIPLRYTVDISHSERAKQYEEIRKEIQENQSLMMRCEAAGTSTPTYVIIESFVAFNQLIDKLENPLDHLISIKPMIVTMDASEFS